VIYTFKCADCNTTMDIKAPIQEGPPQKVKCETCGKLMNRVWNSAIHIPEYMKAGKEGDAHTTITQRMKHATRPTGKNKIYY